jgi:ribonuclease D
VQQPFPRADYIEHDDDFRKIVPLLAQEPLIALDMESNGLYAYRERVCLIQISTRTADYIIDPFRVADLSPLAPILANPAVEKVIHAGDYDLMSLKRDYGFVVHNLFDTMLASRVCGRREMGLDKLLNVFFGVSVTKNHQRDDWGQRPLSEEALRYAQMDTHYLPSLRDHLTAELEQKGRLVEARETFAEATHVTIPNREFDPNGYWHIGVPAGLNRRQIAILRELYLWRDAEAQARDCPAFKVMSDQTLVAIAREAPTLAEQLRDIRGLAASQAGRYTKALLQAVERGRRSKVPERPPRPPDINPVAIERFTVLREWRKSRAEARKVESDVILSKDALWAVALQAPKTLAEMQGIRGLGPWRLATYGEDILNVLKQIEK